MRTVSARLEPFVASGEMVRLPAELYFALIVGPAAHLSRNWLRGRIEFYLVSAVDELSEAAWKCLKAR